MLGGWQKMKGGGEVKQKCYTLLRNVELTALAALSPSVPFSSVSRLRW